MSTRITPTKNIVQMGIFAIVGPALAAYLTWVDLSGVGSDIEWNGLGWASGDDAQYAADVGATINPLGWVIVAGMTVAGILLIASTLLLPVLLRAAAAVFGAIALATAITCLVNPGVLVDGMLDDMGISALDASEVVVTSYIWGEVILSGLMVMSVILIEVGRRRA